jgi:hypothetical protein
MFFSCLHFVVCPVLCIPEEAEETSFVLPLVIGCLFIHTQVLLPYFSAGFDVILWSFSFVSLVICLSKSRFITYYLISFMVKKKRNLHLSH